jgi:hypothetical protein
LEELLDAFGSQGQMALFLDTVGKLLEAQAWVFDVLDQHPHGGLGAQRGERAGWSQDRRLFTLTVIDFLFNGQVAELAGNLDSIQDLILMQIG